MKLSIIIPIYNSEKYLAKCIDSILDEKNNFELLLIDDGSTDHSSTICETYSRKDNRVKYFYKQNGGVSSARNYGIKKANGDYIMFVDSDDSLSANWYNIISHNTTDGTDIFYFTKANNLHTKKNLLNAIVGKRSDNTCIGGPFSKIFKKSFIQNILFNTKLINGEDMIFNITALQKCSNFKIINEEFYFYNTHFGSATNSFDEKIFKTDRDYYAELDNLMSKNTFLTKTEKEEILTFTIHGGIVTLLARIAYIPSYKLAKKYYTFLNDPHYKEKLTPLKAHGKNKKIILTLCKLHMYRILYTIYRTKIKTKK